MLIETDVAAIAEFVARKARQGQRAMSTMPGINMITSGERGTQIMLTFNDEGVVIGQLPHQQFETVGSRKNPVRRPVENERKPHDKRGIDFTDEQIDAILAAWVEGKSPLTLPFVTHVYVEGNLKTK